MAISIANSYSLPGGNIKGIYTFWEFLWPIGSLCVIGRRDQQWIKDVALSSKQLKLVSK